jgi:hypothetical protein
MSHWNEDALTWAIIRLVATYSWHGYRRVQALPMDEGHASDSSTYWPSMIWIDLIIYYLLL